jgi:Tol biopolymer transport system component
MIAGSDAALPAEPSAAKVRAQLSRILQSSRFAGAPSLSRFLAHIVENTLEGKSSELKEYALGIDVFDRGEAFDPRFDTIVRVQARRLRSKLEEYYSAEGAEDLVVIGLAKGRYVPEFRERVRQSPVASSRKVYPGFASAFGAVAAIAVLAGAVRLMDVRKTAVTVPSEYIQLTDFTDSAVAPSLSADGRLVAFIRGGAAFLSTGQIYVKTLPNGEATRLTSSSNRKYAPVFSPDGSRVAYSEVARRGTVTGWDTWTVPVSGGEPSRLLPNATGLVWLDPRRVMFSEFKGPPGHLGIVAATEVRQDERDIYYPAHERGMAHYSYASPDRSSVLIVEMDRDGSFQSCRLVPFDGRSSGQLVGPRGQCRSAAWSPDGQWMYFGADVDGHSHLWRQASAGGVPEQITFGPTEEEGIAVAPDGRSLITSLGRRESAIWIHDRSGDRPLSSEGFAFDPRFSRDGQRVFYLAHESAEASASELRSIDVSSGRVEKLLPGMPISESDVTGPRYDISRDDQEVVFASKGSDGASRIWLARLDRRTPPQELARDGEFPSFGSDDDVFFVTIGKETSFFTRIRKNGSGRERISDLSPIHNRGGISPDGEWAVLYSPAAVTTAPPGTVAVSVHGERAKRICSGLCWAWWSDDGRYFFVSVYDASSPEWTLVIPLQPGVVMPDLPESGMNVPANQLTIPGTRIIEHGKAIAAADPSTYVYVKTELRRNLYRVPLH